MPIYSVFISKESFIRAHNIKNAEKKALKKLVKPKYREEFNIDGGQIDERYASKEEKQQLRSELL